MDVMQHYAEHGYTKTLKLISYLTPAAQRHFAADMAESIGADSETASYLIRLTRGNTEGLVSDEELEQANTRAFYHCTHYLEKVSGRNMVAYFASQPDRYRSAFTATQMALHLQKHTRRAHMRFLADYMQAPGRSLMGSRGSGRL